MKGTLAIALSIFACDAAAGDGDFCYPLTLQERFESSEVVVLAYVIESTYPSIDSKTFYAKFDAALRAIQANHAAKVELPNTYGLRQGTATLAVVKSWKHGVLPGESIKAGPPNGFTSNWWPRSVHVGEEILVFSRVRDPVWLDRCGVMDIDDATREIAALDSLVGTESSDAGPNPRLDRP
jgi:hypothetical protein